MIWGEYMNNEILLSNIRELCKRNNTNVANLEKIMGIGAGTISRWSKASPSFDKVMSIAKYFNVSIDYLSGYSVNSDAEIKIDTRTACVIDYLLKATKEAEGNKCFWHNYEEGSEYTFIVSDLPSSNAKEKDIVKLLYACDENGFYLFDIVHSLNNNYEYDTELRLYLVPDVSVKPALVCSNKAALKLLYITANEYMESIETHIIEEEKVENQIDKIVRKQKEQNETPILYEIAN